MNRLLIATLPLVSVGTASALDGQSQVIIHYYHGVEGASRALIKDLGGGMIETSAKEFSFIVPRSSEVCVLIENAHPVNYAYSLNATVDTSGPELPDVAEYLALLQGLLPATAPARAARPAPAVSNNMDFLRELGNLAKVIKETGTALKNSDLPKRIVVSRT